jgi:hypothetical protein
MTATVLGVSMTAAPVAFGQADLTFKQQREAEARRQAEEREQGQTKEERQAAQQARKQVRREREQLNNMPERARKVLRAETANAQNVDYFREGEEGSRTFGARFTRADGHQMVVRVDNKGTVVSRDDETAAQQAAASAPGQTAAQQPAAAPAPAPAPGQPAPATPGLTRSERGDVPAAGDAFYREIRLDEVPADIRPALERAAAGGRDVKYFRSRYGNEIAYEARYTPANGERQVLFVNERGQLIASRAESAQPANEAATASADDGIKRGRAELNDLPRPVQTKFRQLAPNAEKVEYFQTKWGKQQAYAASFQRDGKEQTYHLDTEGNVLSHRIDGRLVKGGDDDQARTASGRQSAGDNKNEPSDNKDGIKRGRAQLNDLPRPVQTKFRQLAPNNAQNLEVFQTKHGSQQAYAASFERDGKEHSYHLDSEGNVLSHRVDGKLVNESGNNNR